MMRKLILIALMLLAAMTVSARDRLYVQTVNTEALQHGETVTVEVMLDNDTVYSALQTDVYLTGGLEIVKDDEGYACMLSDRATNNHMLSVYEQEDGALRIFVTTQNARVLKDNSGAVFTMEIKTTGDLGEDAAITLRNSIAVEEDATKHTLDDEEYPLFAQGDPLDVNGDGAVDVGDVNTVLGDILNGGTTLAYDVNGDGHVDVGDVNTILAAILNH